MLKARLLIPLLLIAAGAAQAQLLPGAPQLPTLPGTVGDVGRTLGDTVDTARQLPPRALAQARLDRIAGLVRSSRGAIQLDDTGAPARANEVVLTDPTPDALAALQARGYRLIEQSQIEGLGVGFARLAPPSGTKLPEAVRGARAVSNDAAADVLHFESGTTVAPAAATQAGASGAGLTVGVIDGGVGAKLNGPVRQQGFATGAPRPSNHGTAVASLITGGGGVKGAAPGAAIAAADVYGSDRAGGGAVAIARALGWMVGQRVPVVTISLVGPANPLLQRTVAAAQARGTMIVAAVGNDGPAAPPAYPASYPGVIAVTGVDGRGRALIEAGRASHLDYAAPGADIAALDARGRAVKVRGTSFAAPFVAGTIARHYRAPDPAKMRAALAAVDASARPITGGGRGLICGNCGTKK